MAQTYDDMERRSMFPTFLTCFVVTFGEFIDEASLLETKAATRAVRADPLSVAHWADKFLEAPAATIDVFQDLPSTQRKAFFEKISKERVSELVEMAAAAPEPERQRLELFLRSTPFSGLFSANPNKAIAALQLSDETVEAAMFEKPFDFLAKEGEYG